MTMLEVLLYWEVQHLSMTITKWQQNISDIMVDASSKGIPVLGLCYGHQLIGHTYGGKVGPLWSGEKTRENVLSI